MELHVALPMVGGIATILGGIVLLYKGRLALDVAEKAVLVVDIPKLGSIKATSAALGLFVVGAILLIVPLWLADNWRNERTELTKKIEKLEREGYKTVTIQGSLKSDTFPVVIYAAGNQTALENVGEFTLRVPISKNVNDYVIICTTVGKNFSAARVPGDKLLIADALQLNEIAIQAKDPSDVVTERNAFNLLASSPLDQQRPSEYELGSH